MMRLRRPSAIAAPSLVAWAATASAECAWILWKQFEVKTPAPTEPSGSIPHAAETRVQCENALPVSGNQKSTGTSRTRKASD
jgi:hypothetical protein